MKNDEPEPMLSEPELFRRAFGDKARDPGDFADQMRAKDQAEEERSADRFEGGGRGLWYILLWPPMLYVFGLFEPRPTSTTSSYATTIGIGFAVWALAVLSWTPWIIFRVDRRSPRGDSARAAAILAYGLLGWPLALIPLGAAEIFGVPERAPDLMFPVVFGPGVAAMIFASRQTPPPALTRKRAVFLAGGALIYLACAAGLGRLLLGPMLRGLRNAEGPDQDFNGVLMFLVALIASMTAFLSFRLARSAFRAWRGALTAASP
jgi:hypothetical protein